MAKSKRVRVAEIDGDNYVRVIDLVAFFMRVEDILRSEGFAGEISAAKIAIIRRDILEEYL